MDDALPQRLAIRELVENWVIWRDAGDWERFRSVWHADGRMMATWFQGTAEEFIRVSREGWERGVSILHFLGGSSIELASATRSRPTCPACKVPKLSGCTRAGVPGSPGHGQRFRSAVPRARPAGKAGDRIQPG